MHWVVFLSLSKRTSKTGRPYARLNAKDLSREEGVSEWLTPGGNKRKYDEDEEDIDSPERLYYDAYNGEDFDRDDEDEISIKRDSQTLMWQQRSNGSAS